jgi:hypothetical protein
MGIGNVSPMESLDVAGTIMIRGIQQGSGFPVVLNGSKLYYTASSREYKKDIADLSIDPDAVLKLRPVSFRWKSTNQEDIGLVAEEVDEHVKELVIRDEQGRPEGVKYDKISLYLLELVKELKEENVELKRRIEKEIEPLKQKLMVLERMVKQQSYSTVK